jgi:hypothetical protein
MMTMMLMRMTKRLVQRKGKRWKRTKQIRMISAKRARKTEMLMKIIMTGEFPLAKEVMTMMIIASVSADPYTSVDALL